MLLSSFVPALGWALLAFVWQGLLVGVAAASALQALRHARPQTRYAVCCIALALCIALPVVGVWRGLHVDAAVAAMPPVDAPVSIDLVSGQPIAVPRQTWQSTLQLRLPWIVALWSLGAGLLALRMSLGMAWVNRLGRSRPAAIDHALQARLDRIATTIGIGRPVRLRIVHATLASPIAAGIWRPLVLVPASLIAHMPADLLEALLAHELAHVKRHDYLVNLAQGAVEALLFYHPVVWWLSRRIRIEREQVADDLAALALGEPRKLAIALQELDRFQLDRFQFDGFSSSTLTPAANGGNLMSRIQRLIQSGSNRPGQHVLSLKVALPIIGLTAACLAVYAHGSAPAATSDPGTPESATAVAVATAEHAAPADTTSSTSTTSSTRIVDRKGITHTSKRVVRTVDHGDDSYAIVREGQDGVNMSGDSRDLPALERVRHRLHGDFVWLRRDGKSYVVQDPTIIASVEEAWKPAEALGKRMQAMSAQMEVPSKRMEELGRQMEALSGENNPAHAAMGKTGAQMEALARQQEAIGTKMQALGDRIRRANDAQREALERQR